VLHDDGTVFNNSVTGIQALQDGPYIAPFIRGVGKHQIKFRSSGCQERQTPKDVFLQHRGSVGKATRSQISPDQIDRLAAFVYEEAGTGAPTEGFDAQASGTGKQIKNAGPLYLTDKNIK
jgi:hypothetical protein